MTEIELLTGVRELLSDPDHWTRGVFARDKDGVCSQTLAPDACQFCLLGAIAKVSERKTPYAAVMQRISAVSLRNYGVAPAILNDFSKHETVLRLIDLTIKEVENDNPQGEERRNAEVNSSSVSLQRR